MNEPNNRLRASLSWQLIAWGLGMILSASTTYQYATAQAQQQFSLSSSRLSVLESRYDEIDRRLARMETLLQTIFNQQVK